MDRRRRGASNLALAAAIITLALGIWSFTMQDTLGLRYWVTVITVPIVAVSLAAAWQYRYGKHSGAGAAAAVLAWVFLAVYSFRAANLFLPSAVLLTIAWWRGRPREAAREPASLAARVELDRGTATDRLYRSVQ